MEALSNPLWTPLGVVATIILGFVSICVTLWLRNRKSLMYEVLFNGMLVTVQHNIAGQSGDGIEIRYRGTPVQNVRLVSIRIWNSGNIPILRSDYDKPILLAFGGKLLEAHVTETVPPHLEYEVLDRAESESDVSRVQLHPLLLNAKDSVTIQVVLADSNGRVAVHGRVVGVSAIRRASESLRPNTRLVFASIILTVVMGVILVVAPLLRHEPIVLYMFAVVLVALGMGYTVMAWEYLRTYWRRLHPR